MLVLKTINGHNSSARKVMNYLLSRHNVTHSPAWRSNLAIYKCVDCGLEKKSNVSRPGPRRCRACNAKAKNPRAKVIREAAPAYGAVLEEVGLRELKASPGDLIARLEGAPDMEIIITRYGKASAKLVSMGAKPGAVPWSQRASLRGTWPELPEPYDEDFAQAKGIWEPKLDA